MDFRFGFVLICGVVAWLCCLWEVIKLEVKIKRIDDDPYKHFSHLQNQVTTNRDKIIIELCE